MRQRIRWFALHGVVRGLSKFGLRSGDPQARLIADPAVREDPARSPTSSAASGPVIRCRAVLMTFDHAVAHELLRSDDFRVTELGGNLPKPLRWIAHKTDPGLLHPLRPPSLLSVEPPDHTRYRKLVSSVFTPRAVATLRERVEQTATTLLDQLEGNTDVVDIVDRYCSQLPVAIIGDVLGVPDEDRPRILHFGEMGAPSLDIGLSWQQFQQVNAGIVGFNGWLDDHLQQLRRNPGEDLMSQIIRASDEGPRASPSCRRSPALCWPPGSRPQSTCWATEFGCFSTRRTISRRSPPGRSCGPTPSRRSCGWSPRCR